VACAGERSAEGRLPQRERGQPFRGKRRTSDETPTPCVSNEPDGIRVGLPDVAHSIRCGHQVMGQTQSARVPLSDRNPRAFVDSPNARPQDRVSATQRVYRSAARPSL